mgnify:CR=1 FL=1
MSNQSQTKVFFALFNDKINALKSSIYIDYLCNRDDESNLLDEYIVDICVKNIELDFKNIKFVVELYVPKYDLKFY